MNFNDRQMKGVRIVSYAILAVLTVICVVPFVMIISASFSSESALIKEGYGILPKGFSLEAYKMIFETPGTLLNAYKITIFVTVVGTTLAILTTALLAYPLSRKDYKWRTGLNFYLYFTMLFHGGAVASYILITQYLHLRNNIWVLIVPSLVSPWNVFMLRTVFAQINDSLIEAARVDGASEVRTFFNIVIPVSVTGMATLIVLIGMGFWNEWYPCLVYMTTDDKITLQYYLARVMSNIEGLLQDAASTSSTVDLSTLPSESTRMAMCVVAAGPMVFALMFFQKYFVKGISVGSVKG